MTCRQLVELVSDYLEGRLAPSDRARFEGHLAECGDCREYVEQVRETVSALGRLREDSLSAGARDDLLRAFADWHD